MPEFRRKNIRLPAERYVGRQLYFVTLCFHNRRRLGSDSRIARWLVDQLRKHAAACQFFTHAYCVMPDHMHMLAGGACERSNLLKFVMSFKQHTSAEFAAQTHRVLWQFKYYDYILRSRDSVEAVAWYIWMNPVRKGTCETPMAYPFLGSFSEMGAPDVKGRDGRGMDSSVEDAAENSINTWCQSKHAGLKNPALRSNLPIPLTARSES